MTSWDDDISHRRTQINQSEGLADLESLEVGYVSERFGLEQIILLEQPMLPTYPAVLRDGHLEWGNEGAPVVSPNQSIRVHVTVLDSGCLPAANGAEMAAALATIAATGGPTNFGDPVEWQRESRADHTLPGRVE